MSLSKIEILKIIDLLDDFEEMCNKRNIKFNRFTPEELLEFLYLYKAYKLSGDPPF